MISYHIDMKLGRETKLDKKSKTTSKRFDDNVMLAIVTSLSFFEFMVNLEPSGRRILDT